MADIILKRRELGSAETVAIKYHDNGDGTFTEDGLVAAAGGLTNTQLRLTPVPASDAGPAQTVIRTPFTSEDCSSTPVDITTSPAAGLKAVAMDIIVSVDTACELVIKTESGSQIVSAFLPASCGFVQLTLRGYIKGATAAKKLQITTSVAAKVRGLCIWFTEA